MDECQRQFQALLELDARHDALLEQLGELDRRVAKVLAECMVARDSTLPDSQAAHKPLVPTVTPDFSLTTLSSAVETA